MNSTKKFYMWHVRKIATNRQIEVGELHATHQEADTRMLLHAKHAAEYYNDVNLVADDTEILIICLAFSTNIPCDLYMQSGTKFWQRYTGCDTISSFSGQGKLGALTLVINNHKFRDALADLGETGHRHQNFVTSSISSHVVYIV